jgi:hypothetical protein
LYLSVVAVFGLFLASSAPHRVHHFFERIPAADHSAFAKQAHDHAEDAEHSDGNQHKRPASQPTDCYVLTGAQNAHASVVQPFNFAPVACAVIRRQDRPISIKYWFNPAPFSQRAPPLA